MAWAVLQLRGPTSHTSTSRGRSRTTSSCAAIRMMLVRLHCRAPFYRTSSRRSNSRSKRATFSRQRVTATMCWRLDRLTLAIHYSASSYRAAQSRRRRSTRRQEQRPRARRPVLWSAVRPLYSRSRKALSSRQARPKACAVAPAACSRVAVLARPASRTSSCKVMNMLKSSKSSRQLKTSASSEMSIGGYARYQKMVTT